MEQLMKEAIVLNNYEDIITKLYQILREIQRERDQMQLTIAHLEMQLKVKNKIIAQFQKQSFRSKETLRNQKLSQNQVELINCIKSQPIIQQKGSTQMENVFKDIRYSQSCSKARLNINGYFLSLIQKQSMGQIDNSGLEEQAMTRSIYYLQSSLNDLEVKQPSLAKISSEKCIKSSLFGKKYQRKNNRAENNMNNKKIEVLKNNQKQVIGINEVVEQNIQSLGNLFNIQPSQNCERQNTLLKRNKSAASFLAFKQNVHQSTNHFEKQNKATENTNASTESKNLEYEKYLKFDKNNDRNMANQKVKDCENGIDCLNIMKCNIKLRKPLLQLFKYQSLQP